MPSQLISSSAGVVATVSLNVATSRNWSGPVIAALTAKQAIAISSVTAGPAAATANSWPGRSVSRLIFAIPPKNHRSMPVMPMPRRRATSACPSSCRMSETKNSSAEITAIT